MSQQFCALSIIIFLLFLHLQQENSTIYDVSNDYLHEFSWIGNFSLTARDRYIRIGLYAALSLLTIVGNTLTLLAFYKHPALRTTSNLFIVNLAITDLVNGGIKDILFIYGLITYNWQKNRPLCSFVGFINILCFVATIFTLTAIAVFRYLAIVYNFSSKIKRKHVILTIIGIWMYSIIDSLLPIAGWSSYVYDIVECSCLRSLDSKHYSYLVYTITVDAMLPLSIITLCYISIFFNIKKNRSHFNRNTSNRQEHHIGVKLRREETVTRRMVLILIEHVLCFLPYTIIVMILAAKGILIQPVWYFIVGFFVNLNCALNPIMYVLVNPRLKKVCLSVICCKDNLTRVKPTAAPPNKKLMQFNMMA